MNLALQVQKLFEQAASTYAPQFKSETLSVKDASFYEKEINRLLSQVKETVTHPKTIKTLENLNKINNAFLNRFPEARETVMPPEQYRQKLRNAIS